MDGGEKEMPMKASAGLIAVPVGALSIEEEGSEAVVPQEGDEVDVTVVGVVGKSDSGNIYIKPMSFNGVAGGEGQSGDEPETIVADEPTLEEKLGAYRASVGGKMGEEVV